MQKIILLLTLLLVASSCKLWEKPEFVRINKVDVIRADIQTIALKADAVFMNHNHVGGKLKTENIDVFIDDNLIAKVSAEEFKVPSKDEFVIPLSVNVDTSKLIKSNNNGLLGALLNQFLNKRITVRFKGDISYKVAGFKDTYAIDHIEEVQIK